MKRNSTRADLQLVGSATVGGDDDDYGASLEMDAGGWMVGLQLELPLLGIAEKCDVLRSSLEVSRAKNDLAALDDAVQLECRVAVRELLTSVERVSATTEARKLQSRKLELEVEKFKSGRSMTHWLIQYEDDLSRAEMARFAAIAQYHKGVARVRAAQGRMPGVRSPAAAKAMEDTAK
jgi:outer membrane protein TolC